MHKSTLLFAFAVVAWLFAEGCFTSPMVIALRPVPLKAQQESRWCWAASGQMIMNYLDANPPVMQCDEANKRFDKKNCCESPKLCNGTGWPEFGKYGFTALHTTGAALTWDELRGQIDQNKPFACSWRCNEGGGHMAVAIGYLFIAGEQWVVINDPWPPGKGDTKVSLYTAYVSGRHYTHWNDYYNITKQSKP